MANSSARAVCKFSNEKVHHRGASITNVSKTARTAPPNAKIAKLMARCVFKRHHCTRRRMSRVRNWCGMPGVSLSNPRNGSSELQEPPISATLQAMAPGLGASRSASPVLPLRSGRTFRVWGPRRPCRSNSASVWSRAMVLPRDTRYSKNCFLVTAVAPRPAMRLSNSSTTSAVGCSAEHRASSSRNSPASMKPSLLRST
mmetsp:Transcript_100778/g.308118  ORF Transcript_100778/g.308118 Transcript_100778/m.308118 type:complete len:200 (-) Transcript_100778:1357-1956(-)